MTSARRSPRRRLVGALAALSVACLAWSCRMHSADADFTSADHADATAPADGVTGSDGAPGAGPAAADGADQVLIGQVRWYVDYKAALAIARAKDQPLWVHFGENPG